MGAVTDGFFEVHLEQVLEECREALGTEEVLLEATIEDQEPTQLQLGKSDFQQALGGRLKSYFEKWRDPYTRKMLEFGVTWTWQSGILIPELDLDNKRAQKSNLALEQTFLE